MYQVYKHICPNGKVYIGMTGLEVEKRWQNGFGYTDNQAFFHDIVRFGWDNIIHQILSVHSTKEEALREEAYQILLHNSTDSFYGYNFAQRGTAHTAPVAQYTKDGKHIATYQSLKDASEATGVNISTLCCCCKGYQGTSKRKTAGGFIWKYA
jgi:hypothetical protein